MTTYVAVPQAVVDAIRHMIRQMGEEDTDYQSISTASSILALVRFLLVRNNMLTCRHSIAVDSIWHAHCKGCGALFRRKGRDDAWHDRDVLVYGRLLEMLGLISSREISEARAKVSGEHDHLAYPEDGSSQVHS
ncbi:MAG: hypothetical protein RMJ59_02120 [Candidatus Nitrosocaldus sp.]|nr:hypothetical protein [Candidatus Nitrosocaldus sp.]MCS7141553.1 hypothetical protein [Candidatus Nitrosocaldus sp.]MDW8000327.1 hypothetical protein [Candidatus Nitrosocaldus sp.]MDW8275163.1 hypothetical protein [Candidatus Nitrosocaldus sp.]